MYTDSVAVVKWTCQNGHENEDNMYDEDRIYHGQNEIFICRTSGCQERVHVIVNIEVSPIK